MNGFPEEKELKFELKSMKAELSTEEIFSCTTSISLGMDIFIYPFPTKVNHQT